MHRLAEEGGVRTLALLSLMAARAGRARHGGATSLTDASARVHPTADIEQDVSIGPGTTIWNRAQVRQRRTDRRRVHRWPRCVHRRRSGHRRPGEDPERRAHLSRRHRGRRRLHRSECDPYQRSLSALHHSGRRARAWRRLGGEPDPASDRGVDRGRGRGRGRPRCRALCHRRCRGRRDSRRPGPRARGWQPGATAGLGVCMRAAPGGSDRTSRARRRFGRRSVWCVWVPLRD